MVCRSLPRSHWQDQAPLRLLRWSQRFETQFPVDGNRPFIGRVRIGADNRYPRIEESPHSRPDKRCPVSNPDHFGVSYVLIDPPRSLGKLGEMVIFPAVDGIVLHERKGAFGG